MAVHIHGIIVVVRKVPAADVVDVAVGVIVDAITRDLRRVQVNIARKFRVVVVNAGVYDGNDHAAIARQVIPGFWCVDVSIGKPSCLTGVVQSPELAKVRIVGEEGGRDNVIKFAELNQG